MEKKFALRRITPRQFIVSGLLSVGVLFASSGVLAKDSPADALLQIDLNRAAVVDKVVATWSGEISASDRTAFRAGLSGLRADRLLAASLAGSYEGALEAMLGRVSASGIPTLAAGISVQTAPSVGSARSFQINTDSALQSHASASRDAAKALGEPTRDFVYTPITPCRLHDSRAGQSSALGTLGGVMAQQTSRTIAPAGKCGIPASGVKSIFLSFHAYNNNPSVLGVVAFQKTGDPVTGLAAAWTGNVWVVSTAITATLDNGSFDVFVGNVVPMTAEMIIDVSGYFTAPDRDGDGLRIVQNAGQAPTTELGLAANTAAGNGASVLGGGKIGSNCTNPLTSALDYNCANRATGEVATVVGGYANFSNSFAASVFGGQTNTVGLTGKPADNGTIVGGQFNIVSEQNATIVGGRNGQSSGFGSTIVGGTNNSASNDQSVVVGGANNRSTGVNSVSIGGRNNLASGSGSFAGGTRAYTQDNASATPTVHNGAFVWADSTNADFFSTRNDEFSVRASGGVRMVTGGGSCSLPAGGTPSWVCVSDRNAKEFITTIDPKSILSKVIAMPLTTWSYKGVTRRHLSPMAQDFWAAFGLGVDDKSIVSSDVSGVALAAVQGVNQKLNEEVAALKNQNAKLHKELMIIKKKLGL